MEIRLYFNSSQKNAGECHPAFSRVKKDLRKSWTFSKASWQYTMSVAASDVYNWKTEKHISENASSGGYSLKWLPLTFMTLCGPVGCSPPGSSVHGILHPRILEWIAMLSSRGSLRPRDRTRFSWFQKFSWQRYQAMKFNKVNTHNHLLDEETEPDQLPEVLHPRCLWTTLPDLKW